MEMSNVICQEEADVFVPMAWSFRFNIRPVPSVAELKTPASCQAKLASVVSNVVRQRQLALAVAVPSTCSG